MDELTREQIEEYIAQATSLVNAMKQIYDDTISGIEIEILDKITSLQIQMNEAQTKILEIQNEINTIV